MEFVTMGVVENFRSGMSSAKILTEHVQSKNVEQKLTSELNNPRIYLKIDD